ncbi:MAG: PHP domain-containing protein [Chthoniobacterales bacterium]
MFHRFDPHVHTWFSADAASSPEEVIRVARARGLSGIALTDHDSCRASDYCLQAGLMREDGDAVEGFLIIPGVEVSTAEGHLLCYGVRFEGAKRKGAPVAEIIEEVQAVGGLCVPAHPYDGWRAGISEKVLDALPLFAVETFNAAVSSKKYNDRAKHYAQKRGLIATAGSDAHHAGAVGTATTGLEMESLTVSEFLRALQSETRLEENYLTYKESLKKHVGNFLRILNPKPKPRID